jgi:hypothetical protein
MGRLAMRTWLMMVMVFFALPMHTACAETSSDDVAQLLEGVKTIAWPGVPGPIVVTGEDAFPIVTVGDAQAVVAGARLGRGRIVVFGHGGFLGATSHDTTQLLANAAQWAAGRKRGQIALWGAPAHLREALGSDAASYAFLEGEQVDALDKADVIILDSHHMRDADMRRQILRFVRQGGGLVTAGLGWGWLQLNPGQTIEQHPGNLLLADAGLAFGPGYLRSGESYDVPALPARFAHAGRALDALREGITGDDAATAAKSISEALRAGPHMTAFQKEVQRLLRDQHDVLEARIANMATDGLTWKDDALARLAVELYMTQAFDAPAARVVKHPSADGFPGAIAAGAETVTREFTVHLDQPGWQTTGLYAPAGELLQVRMDKAHADAGLFVQIGSHLDPESRGELERLPRVVRRFALEEANVRAANAVGGLIYIDVPRDVAAKHQGETIAVRISGAVEAPVYVRGETTDAQWNERIRRHPAPWGELIGDDIIITLPSDLLRELDNPTDVITFWDEVVASMGAMQPRRGDGYGDQRVRLVPDISVSWGYMYAPSNKPLTFPLHTAKNMLDLDRLRTNEGGDVWGFFHELGHFHQDPMWTFDGTGEVTVNLFTLRAIQDVCGQSPAEARDFTPENLLTTMREHHEAGAPFDVWKRRPFLALAMYVQVIQAFGWAPLDAVFAEYRALLPDARPRDDDAKRDQWLVRLSRAVGRDLSGFFEAWGVPTSEAAQQSLADLPAWMPDGWDVSPVNRTTHETE